MKLPSLFSCIGFLVLFSDTTAVPAPQPGSRPLTNAQRFRRGLPPASPRRLYNNRWNQHPSPSPGSHKPCKIRVVRASTSEDLGYIARDLGPFILPVYTRNKSSASKYACPIQDKPKQELRQINPPDHDHPYLAPYEANEVYKILGTTGHTAPGATKGSTGSTRSALSRPESSVWSLSSSTDELTLTWVQDDKGTNVPLHPFSTGDGPSKGYMMAAIDRHAFQSTFPNAFELRFFAELDT